MKKIGIITIYDEDNYGNRLQNYAVQQVLKSMNFDVETIKNTNLVDGVNFYERQKKNQNKDRLARFLEFNNEYMTNTEEIILHNEIDDMFHEKYDYFVIGSDQIWNYKFRDKFSDFSFASFAPEEKRISFSASFGIGEVPKEVHKRYDGLNVMKAISVREFAGADIVKEITGREEAVVLLDPTMMLSHNDWDVVAKRPKQLNSDKYILKYFLGNVSEEKEEEIQRFAKENGCDVIDILDKDSFYATGPSEFVYLIKNAFLVLTDSFHSCVFSIIYDRPFLIFERDEEGMRDMNSRIDTLLTRFNLSGKRFNGKIANENLETDYSNVAEILKAEQKNTIEFLKTALEVEEQVS